MSTPANAIEPPSIAKVWLQFKDNAPTFGTIWGLILIAGLINEVVQRLFHFHLILNEHVESLSGLSLITAVVTSLPTTILYSLALILMTAVPAIYYAMDRCLKPGEIVGILARKPLRYVLGGVLFTIAVFIGFLFCIIPGILAMLVRPLYVHYVFTTDLNLITCLSKAFKGMFQDFASYFLVSLLCFLATVGSILLCVFPVLAVLPMTELYMQNYIHHKGLVGVWRGLA